MRNMRFILTFAILCVAILVSRADDIPTFDEVQKPPSNPLTTVLNWFGFGSWLSSSGSVAKDNVNVWWGPQQPGSQNQVDLKNLPTFDQVQNPPSNPVSRFVQTLQDDVRGVVQKGQQLFEPYSPNNGAANNNPFGIKAYEQAAPKGQSPPVPSSQVPAPNSQVKNPPINPPVGQPNDLYYQTVPLAPNKWGFKDARVLAPPPDSTTTIPTRPAPAQTFNPDKYQTQETFPPPEYQSSAQSPPPRQNYSSAVYQQIVAIANGVRGVAARYGGVGGISLNKAAAERMALNVDIESLTFRDGRIVLSGTQSPAAKIDAALFLTALRLACEPNDPSFSLDPVDGAAWAEQGRSALQTVWDRLHDSYNRGAGVPGLSIETFSVRREYPSLWQELEPRYPELRTRLVFRPAALRDTRVGEILYKADVLLKELTSGLSLIQPSLRLRANEIPGYVPAYHRSVAVDLASSGRARASGWKGYRLWFDLMPQAGEAASPSTGGPDGSADRNKFPDLYALLQQRGFVGGPAVNAVRKTALFTSADIIDVSEVYPKMFVRRHDLASGKDISGNDPDLDLLSADVNARTALYVNAYQELHELTDVFRAYVASVKLVQQHRNLCSAVAKLPLSNGEKVTAPLPKFHPSELFITVARYTFDQNGSLGWRVQSGTAISGGIALRGKQFAAVAAIESETPIIAKVRQDLATSARPPMWTSAGGRRYLEFNVDDPPPRAPILAANSEK
jgi:hypothetical protein